MLTQTVVGNITSLKISVVFNTAAVETRSQFNTAAFVLTILQMSILPMSTWLFFGPRHDGNQPVYDSCRFTAGETNLMMKSQQELYVYTYDKNPAKKEYSNFFGYNEVIISALDFGTMVTGFFWAHEGGFQDKLTAADLAELQAVCAQSLQVATVRPVSLLGEASTKSGRVESRAIPPEWQDALKSGALPIFEMIGFHANSSPPTPVPASFLSSVVDVIKGNQPPSTGAEVIRVVTPEARSQIVKVCAP